jgi:hypothetical protein
MIDFDEAIEDLAVLVAQCVAAGDAGVLDCDQAAVMDVRVIFQLVETVVPALVTLR